MIHSTGELLDWQQQCEAGMLFVIVLIQKKEKERTALRNIKI